MSHLGGVEICPVRDDVDPRTMSVSSLPPVLILGDHFGYPSGVAHGVTAYFLNVLPALKRASVEFTACYLREPHPSAAALPASGIEPMFLSAHRMNPLVVFRVAAIARQHGCQIIHAAGIKAALVARVVARMVGAKVIVHLHDLIYPGWAVSRLHQLFARHDDLAVCVSQAAVVVAVRGYHVEPQRVRVVNNGIQLDLIRNLPAETRVRVRQQLGIAAATSVLAMVGRMYPIKGHRSMMQILSQVVRSCPEIVMIFAGDGPERTACEAMTDELGLRKQVMFLGQRNDVPELLAAADIVVMPSVSEGLPIAAIEAMAAGRPVVGFNVGGFPEIVADEVNGRLVPAADNNAFAEALVSLLQDPEKIACFGRNALVNAGRFSIADHIEALLKCYQEVAA